MGHVHLNTKDPGAQKKFWVDVIGAEETKLGTMPAFKMPGVLILVRKADPSGGTEGYGIFPRRWPRLRRRRSRW